MILKLTELIVKTDWSQAEAFSKMFTGNLVNDI